QAGRAIAAAAAGLAELAAHRGEFGQAHQYYTRARHQLEATLDDAAAEADGEPPRLALHAAVLRGQARVHSLTGSPARARPLLEEALKRLGVQAFRRSGVQEGDQSSAEPEGLNARTPERLNAVLLREYVRCLTAQAHALCSLGE